MPDIDPLTTIHNALWDGVEAVDSGDDPLVKSGNRINFTDAGNKKLNHAPKDKVRTADLPELMLWLQSVEMLGGTSNAREATFNFLWLGSTGSYYLGKIYPVSWLLMRAAEYVDTVKGNYSYGGIPNFITGVTTPNGVITDADQNLNRGLKGFSTLWTTQVTAYIPNPVIEV